MGSVRLGGFIWVRTFAKLGWVSDLISDGDKYM